MNTLKPCPFCGGAKICTEKSINLNYCDNCSAESNIDHWNTRPIEDALNARIAELESKQRWISVKERLPELDEDVFVLLENGIGYGCLSEYKGEINWHLDFDAYGNVVYYWMPIPDEPGVKK